MQVIDDCVRKMGGGPRVDAADVVSLAQQFVHGGLTEAAGGAGDQHGDGSRHERMIGTSCDSLGVEDAHGRSPWAWDSCIFTA